jgi:carbonic anhydrase
VQDVRERHADLLDDWPVGEARYRRLIELNAIEQVVNVCRTTIVNDAWARGQSLTVHGLVYGVHDGRMRNLGMAVSNFEALDETYKRCVAALTAGGEHAPDNDMIAADAARLEGVAQAVAATLKPCDDAK